MADSQETEQQVETAEAPTPAAEPERAPAPPEAKAAPTERPERKPQGDRPQGDRPQGERRGGPQGQGQRREGGGREGGGNREGRGPHEGGRDRGRDRDDRRGGDRGRFEGPPEIDIEKLISDPLYLDNQAHGVVSRMRDMDSGTKSQLRRLYNAVRRAVRAPENERQQQFVMLRARLAYTIARHSLRSLDSLEKLLLQVTRKNDARGYERFRDLFEAIVAYNE
ncbi:MAG TPA: type III-A CRISPR-associated protein Csm2 [Bryobacteraceae bacterium]|nr:type III-A CRISPR-associated protein Csm2 [Bryobacteraceae bacterium]